MDCGGRVVFGATLTQDSRHGELRQFVFVHSSAFGANCFAKINLCVAPKHSSKSDGYEAMPLEENASWLGTRVVEDAARYSLGSARQFWGQGPRKHALPEISRSTESPKNDFHI